MGDNRHDTFRSPMKIATYNVNSIRQRLPIVLDWLAENKPDVMCLQETKSMRFARPGIMPLSAA
jgi:exonuclease III